MTKVKNDTFYKVCLSNKRIESVIGVVRVDRPTMHNLNKLTTYDSAKDNVFLKF